MLIADRETIMPLINKLLDGIKQRENLHSDAALARHLQTTNMSIVRWRRGKVSPSTAILLPQAFSAQP